MSKNKASKEFNIRNRLVGTIVLLAAGVILIPMFLKGNGPGSGVDNLRIKDEVKQLIAGSEDEETFISRIQPYSQAHQQAVHAVDQQKQPVLKQDLAKPATTQEKDPDKVISKSKADKKNSKNNLKEEDVSRGWTIRVGTFSKTENAQNLIKKLNDFGFNSRYETIETDSGKATRIWVGPYEKRVTAGRILEDVRQATGLKGYIKSYP